MIGNWFRCHKVVSAAKITAVVEKVDEEGPSAERYLELEGTTARVYMLASWMEKHKPVAGGYFVEYKDGYTSFSPAEAFEEGYSREQLTRCSEITFHHDGHGLNEAIAIDADAPDGSGASHRFVFTIGSKGSGNAGFLQFQKGPRNVEGSTPGVTEAAVIAILIDRLRGFQSGPYCCQENAHVLKALEEALYWTRARADERARRGVLGTNLK